MCKCEYLKNKVDKNGDAIVDIGLKLDSFQRIQGSLSRRVEDLSTKINNLFAVQKIDDISKQFDKKNISIKAAPNKIIPFLKWRNTYNELPEFGERVLGFNHYDGIFKVIYRDEALNAGGPGFWKSDGEKTDGCSLYVYNWWLPLEKPELK